MKKTDEKLKPNYAKLAGKYGCDEKTIRKHARLFIKSTDDISKPTQEEYDAFIEYEDKLLAQKQAKDRLEKVYSGADLGGTIKFDDNKSSLVDRLRIAREKYNYYAKTSRIDEAKLQEVKESNEYSLTDKTIYNNIAISTSKTLNMWDSKVKELEKDLSLMNIEEDNPFER